LKSSFLLVILSAHPLIHLTSILHLMLDYSSLLWCSKEELLKQKLSLRDC